MQPERSRRTEDVLLLFTANMSAGALMTKVRYTGVTDPKAAFEALRDYHHALIKLQTRCRPFGADYLVILAARGPLEPPPSPSPRASGFYAGAPHGCPAPPRRPPKGWAGGRPPLSG